MSRQLGSVVTLAAGLLIAGAAAGGETVRLVDRPAAKDETRTLKATKAETQALKSTKGDTRTLKLTPEDREATTTEQTHWWGRGWGWGGGLGWGRGWGGWGWGGGGWGWGRGWGWGGWGGGWGLGLGYSGYRPWGWGYGLGYSGWPYDSGYGGWPVTYSLYTPSYYYAPVYSYYSVPAVGYYASPIYYSSPIVYQDCCPPATTTTTVVPERVESTPPATNGSFRYDGGPARPIPPAREAEPVPADPKAPKVGPSPTDRPISLPAARKKHAYPAYGEGPDSPKPARPARELLVSN